MTNAARGINLPFSEPLPYHLSAYLRRIQQKRWDGEEDTSRLTDQLLDILAEQAGSIFFSIPAFLLIHQEALN